MSDSISRRRMLFAGFAAATLPLARRLPGGTEEADPDSEEGTAHGYVLQNLHIEQHGNGPAIVINDPSKSTLISDTSVCRARA